MDALVSTLARNEDEAVAGWLKLLETIKGAPFGGAQWTDPAKEARIAYKSLLAMLENGDQKPAEEQAARLARLPSQCGAGIMATIRGWYALFEPLRAILDRVYADRRQELSSDVVRLRDGVATMTGLITVAYFKQGLTWQDQAERYARQRLNGPLAKMSGDLLSFSAAAGSELSPAIQANLRNMTNYSREILRAAEGITIMWRLGEGRLSPVGATVPLAETLAPVAEEARRKASFDNRTFTWKPPGPGEAAIGDADLLRRAFAFVLHRALNESPEGRTVRAEVLDDPEAVRIVVRDEGPGEPPEEGQGEGFELAFARMVVAHMEGRCDVFRESGRGTMIQLKLRRAMLAAPPKPAPSAPAATAAPPAAKPTEIRITRGILPPGGGKPPPAKPA